MEITFDAWKEAKVAPTRHRIDVEAGPDDIKLEPVSPRLKAQLIHPNAEGYLSNVIWSPDGKRLLAGDYPGGTVQVWDVTSGRVLTKIETGRLLRSSSEYVHVSPDWSTQFVASEKRKITRIEKDGKQLTRWEFDGAIQTWDLATGAAGRSFQHSPPRNVRTLVSSPDGATMIAGGQVPGEYERGPDHVMSLWNTRTGEFHSLPAGVGGYGLFSHDSTLVAVTEDDADGLTKAIRVFDSSNAQEKLSIPIETPLTSVEVIGFTRDSQYLLASYAVRPERRDWSNSKYSSKWLDIRTGKEVASLELENKSMMMMPTFSPDGKTLAVTTWRPGVCKLFLYDVASRNLRHTVELADQGTVRHLGFSPDSRWLAVPAQVIPSDLDDGASPEDVPQPRIYLVDVAAGKLCETIVSPPAFLHAAKFSPDGKTLASDGHGKVLLWDMTQPPGTVNQESSATPNP